MTINHNKDGSPIISEESRIRSVYSGRDVEGKASLYAWHKPFSRYQSAIKERMFALVLNEALGANLSDLNALDVGCGTGAFLRLLLEWGGRPNKLVGTEFLKDRLDVAKRNSPAEVNWFLGGINDLDDGEGFDLVSAHTVFTSILEDDTRAELARSMWDLIRPGGWIMIYDFRYDNPNNTNVRKLTKTELEYWWPAKETIYRTGILAPPLARRLVGSNYLVAEFFALLFPLLRTHFVYMARK